MIKVTTIIPTFNRGYCLAESIQSVLDQNFSDFELIVVDDGSTDNTAEVIEQFSGIHKIRIKKNRGVSFARNLAIKQARGEWIAFLDSDDLWERDKLAIQMNWVECNPDYHAVYTDEIWIRNGVRVNAMKKHRKYSGDIFRHCLPLCIVSPSSVLLRNELLNKFGGFDESMPVCEDYDLWLRISMSFPFHFIEEKLIVKRGGHEDQLSRKFWGMDRWRVHSLKKLLQENQMNEEQRGLVMEMLVEKCNILACGYEKRGKIRERDYYRSLKTSYSGLIGKPLQ
ncbi:MAG: glycosyltransferase family 2 protein [Nitrospinia bacterium]|jgi:glycosyltransferase involved in cell wall biosynthesis|tara:strand:+ start:2107 stop:2952 length:846 start_codon:yes stop_codon:yes gene_type:complete